MLLAMLLDITPTQPGRHGAGEYTAATHQRALPGGQPTAAQSTRNWQGAPPPPWATCTIHGANNTLTTRPGRQAKQIIMELPKARIRVPKVLTVRTAWLAVSPQGLLLLPLC